jgi:hypothetical protein
MTERAELLLFYMSSYKKADFIYNNNMSQPLLSLWDTVTVSNSSRVILTPPSGYFSLNGLQVFGCKSSLLRWINLELLKQEEI